MAVKQMTNISDKVESLTKFPENYLSVQEDVANEIKKITKKLYDLNQEEGASAEENPGVLDELIVENFDEEQIWQQIELQNNFICQKLLSEIANLLANKNKFFSENHEDEESIHDDDNDDNDDDDDDYDDNDDRMCFNENEGDVLSVDNVEEEEEASEAESDSDANGDNDDDYHKKSSIVDDRFFKLSDMEKFLEKEESDKKKDSDEDDINYFDGYSSDGSNNSRENDCYYGEFFDPPDDVQVKRKRRKEGSFEHQKNVDLVKKVKFSLNDDEDKEIDSESDLKSDELSHEVSENNQQALSTFEARQERLKSRIKALEQEALKEKPWQMKGEVTGTSRPQNSLLEEYVEFDTATRPAPVMTEKTTLKLEDIIKQRIKDKAWDDVERKIKPIENPREYKKRLVLDQEKSKLSLAQIYEQEYLKQKEAQSNTAEDKPDEVPKERAEIDKMMKELFSKLDALSNFHFTPRMATTEVKIISNLPAVTVEEVAPVATSDAALLAPEEIKSKMKGDLIGRSERTKTDKKRERRLKKKKQRLKYIEMERRISSRTENKNSATKDAKDQKKLIKKLVQSSNVSQVKVSGDGKHIKSSNAFFSKLQDEAKTIINKKSVDSKNIKKKKKLNVKKLKL